MTSTKNNGRPDSVRLAGAAGDDGGQGSQSDVLERNVGRLVAQAERIPTVDAGARARIKAVLLDARHAASGRNGSMEGRVEEAHREPVADGARAVAAPATHGQMARWWPIGLAAAVLLALGGGWLWMRSRHVSHHVPTRGRVQGTSVSSDRVAARTTSEHGQSRVGDSPTHRIPHHGLWVVALRIRTWAEGMGRALVAQSQRAVRLLIAVLSRLDKVGGTMAKRRVRGRRSIPRSTTPRENEPVNVLDGL